MSEKLTKEELLGELAAQERTPKIVRLSKKASTQLKELIVKHFEGCNEKSK